MKFGFDEFGNDDYTILSKKYIKTELKFVIILAVTFVILMLIYNTAWGKNWLSNNLYVLIIIGAIFTGIYVFIYFRHKRRLGKLLYPERKENSEEENFE